MKRRALLQDMRCLRRLSGKGRALLQNVHCLRRLSGKGEHCYQMRHCLGGGIVRIYTSSVLAVVEGRALTL